jgi:hypothetical protein
MKGNEGEGAIRAVDLLIAKAACRGLGEPI